MGSVPSRRRIKSGNKPSTFFLSANRFPSSAGRRPIFPMTHRPTGECEFCFTPEMDTATTITGRSRPALRSIGDFSAFISRTLPEKMALPQQPTVSASIPPGRLATVPIRAALFWRFPGGFSRFFSASRRCAVFVAGVVRGGMYPGRAGSVVMICVLRLRRVGRCWRFVRSAGEVRLTAEVITSIPFAEANPTNAAGGLPGMRAESG